MLNLAKISSQELNMLFTFLNSLDSVVFWISNPDYSKQLYVNKAFEAIWGRPTDELQNYPILWTNSLADGELERIATELQRRSSEKGAGSMGFKIHRPDGELRYLKNTSFTLVDAQGKPTLIAGVDENLTPERWERSMLNPQEQTMQAAFLNQFLEIIEKNSGLHIQSSEIVENSKKIGEQMAIEGNIIPLSRRESQCLQFLLEGKSAKQTAYLLHLSTRTVETYLDSLRHKAKCRTKLELIGKLQANLLCD